MMELICFLCIFKVDSSEKKDTVVDMPLPQTAEELSADHFPFARRYIYAHTHIDN